MKLDAAHMYEYCGPWYRQYRLDYSRSALTQLRS